MFIYLSIYLFIYLYIYIYNFVYIYIYAYASQFSLKPSVLQCLGAKMQALANAPGDTWASGCYTAVPWETHDQNLGYPILGIGW